MSNNYDGNKIYAGNLSAHNFKKNLVKTEFQDQNGVWYPISVVSFLNIDKWWDDPRLENHCYFDPTNQTIYSLRQSIDRTLPANQIPLTNANIDTFFDKIGGNIAPQPVQTHSFISETITTEEGYFTTPNQLGDEEYLTLPSTVTVAKTRFYANNPVSSNTVLELVKNGVTVATMTILSGQKTITSFTPYTLNDGDRLRIRFVSGDTQVKFATNFIGIIN